LNLNKLNITETIDNARKLIESEKQISPAMKAMFEMLLMIITLFAERFGLNSKNSSKPPATDQNRKKKKRNNGTNKPGGQPGHVGTTLQPVDNPDNIIPIKLDKRRLPKGQYREIGFESRQVVDIEISRVVTEYRAQVLEDEQGKRYVADFPVGICRPYPVWAID
jgi:transposase